MERIKAKSSKVNRYQQRVSQFQQNRFCTNNEDRFYKQIDGSAEEEKNAIPCAQEAKAFWKEFWG